MTRQIDRRTALAGLAALGALGAAPGIARAQEAGVALGVFSEGDPAAPVTVIEYVSLTCPHCATFHKTVYGDLKRAYIDTGKIRMEFREVYFDRVGLWAAMLARCGGRDRYFGFVDLLLTRQQEWTRTEDFMGEFKRMGKLGGLSEAQVETCLNDSDAQRALVEQYQEYYEDPRLTGTPTLIVGEEKVETPSFENLSAAIDRALGA